MRLEYSCPTCSKPASIQCEIPMGNLVHYVYRCGHVELREPFETKEEKVKKLSEALIHEMNLNRIDEAEKAHLAIQADESFNSLNGVKRAYPFQIEGIKFLEKTGISGMIADAMGLGKTIQALLTFRRNFEDVTPTLFLVKSSTIFQWIREFKEWADSSPAGIFPILSKKNIIPGMPAYIMSMDLLARKGVLEELKKCGIKAVVVDESHSFKDPNSARTGALIKLITECRIEKKIFLTGTPIKNRADEYFTALNLLAPAHFRSPSAFRHTWLEPNEKGVYTRVNRYRLEEFKSLTSRWILRREKHDVLTNLPPLTRNYEWIEIDDPIIKNSYNRQLELFDNFLNTAEKISAVDILGWLARLRNITGTAKCGHAIEWSKQFLEESDESLAIGIHHQSVRDGLYYEFSESGLNPLKLSGEDSSWVKDSIVRKFNSGTHRLLVINAIAGGVGLNLQSCANALFLERLWNAADEEQFEARFHRDGQKKAVTVTYMLAGGTLDEWLTEIVEEKRKIFGETIQGWDLTGDDEALRGLAEKTISNRLR